MRNETFAFFDAFNHRFSNEFLYHNIRIDWYTDYQLFLDCQHNNRYYYLWEINFKNNFDCLDNLPEKLKANRVKVFLDLCTGEISPKRYPTLVEKIKNYGVQHFVIHLNTQYEFDKLNSMFGSDKPLIFLSNRNEIHFYENLITSKRPKRFLFLCRRFSVNRLLIFLDLHKRGILNNCHYTFGTYENVYGDKADYTVQSTQYILDLFQGRFLPFFDNPYVKDIYDYALDNRHIFDTLPKFIGKFANQNPSDLANLFNESYISLLIESKLGNDELLYQPSEKIMKCFYYNHPFLVYSTPNFLKYTKMSGYKTFGVFDELYDQIPNMIDRIKYLNDYVEKLNKLDDFNFMNVYNECLPNVYHNHNVLTSKMKNHFADFMYNKPDSAESHLFQGRIQFSEYR